MSDHIPFEIQKEIVKRLPVKSLLQFRSVSKSWKSLIDSSEFITNYHSSHTHLQPRLLVRSMKSIPYDFDDEKYVSIVNDDDDSFPKHAFTLIVPSSVKLLGDFQMTLVIWNPAIRKSLDIVVPNVQIRHQVDTILGFRVCPRTSDPKLVKLTCILSWQAEVFALNLGAWRNLSNKMPCVSIEVTWVQVCVDRFIYWLGVDRNPVDNAFPFKNLFLSFDMISDEFAEIYLPDSLAKLDYNDLEISKLRTSLVVLETDMEVEKYEHCVWRMEHGVPNSFTKLFIIRAPDAPIYGLLGFRNAGEPIFEIYNSIDDKNALFCFDPESENISEIENCGVGCSGFACSYMETLLLLDH